MNSIPEQLRFKMMTDAIILKKNIMGWCAIHETLLNKSLYLKKTTTPYFDCSLVYEHILRANTTVYFANGKTFTWLKRMSDNPLMYFYRPSYMEAELYTITTNSYGYFLY